MSARLNLAPEVYQTSQRQKHRRKVATTAAITVSLIAAGLVVLGLVVVGGQNIYLGTVNAQIKERQEKVRSYSELQDAATAQQHLATLAGLTNSKARFSRFFEVLQQFAPQGVVASKIIISEDNVIEMSGTAKTYELVTKLVKALEAGNVQIGSNAAATNQPYFSNVELSGVSDNGGNQGVSFKVTAKMSSEVTSGN